MKLKYIVQPTELGGTAIPHCGTIHKSEIETTLSQLSDDTDFISDFNEYIIGSTGKRDYSGDIDLVVDTQFFDPNDIAHFRTTLEITFGSENVARNGNILHLRYPIVGYSPAYNECLPRTGFVQIDFNFGDFEWESFYHYCDGNSGYKGAHRNLLIAAICSSVNIKPVIHEYNEKEIPIVWEGDRPANIIRWKWGSNGLIRVNRKSVKDKHGHWKKKQEDTVIEGPYIKNYDIVGALLPMTASPFALNSMESTMDAIKENFGMVDQERIWKRAAHNFSDWNQGKLFEYPEEISRYFLSNDK